MISTWNIKKFSRSKVPLAQSTIPVSNTWNHFLDENLNVIFLLNNVINDNYGTLRVVQKSYQNVIETICFTKQNIETMNFNIIKKDCIIGLQYKTQAEEIKIQFIFYNGNDASSFFNFFSPFIPYKILKDDYTVAKESTNALNLNSTQTTIFSSPIHSTLTPTQRNENCSLPNHQFSISTILPSNSNSDDNAVNMMNSNIETPSNKDNTVNNLNVFNSAEKPKKGKKSDNNSKKGKSAKEKNKSDTDQSTNNLESTDDSILILQEQQKINEQINQYLKIPNYQLLKYIIEILENPNFVELVEKINELYSSYISE